MKRLTIAVLLGASLAAFGCSKQEPSGSSQVSAADVRKETKEAVGTAAQYVEREKDEFVRTAQQDLDQLRDRLAQLKSQAQSATGEAKDRLDAQVARLEPQWRAAESKLAELKAAGAEKWREAKDMLAQQLSELKQSFDQEPRQSKAG